MASERRRTKWVGLTPNPDKYFGFCYLVTNLITGQMYVGRKFYHKWSRGKKAAESDWATYKTSSKWGKEDIRDLGEENFIFEIIGQYTTRGGCVYAETHIQHMMEVLTAKLPDGTPQFYNKSIGGIKFIPKEDVSDETRKRMSEAAKGNTSHVDTTVYHWYNVKDDYEVKMTQGKLKKKYNLGSGHVSQVINGKLEHINGWCLYENKDKVSIKSTKGATIAIEKNGVVETGTQTELSDKLNLVQSKLSRLVLGKQQTHKGWRLVINDRTNTIR